MFDRGRPRPVARSAPEAPAATQPSESTRGLLLKIDGLTSEVSALKRARDEDHVQLRAAADDRDQLRYLLDQAERRANKAEHDVKAARARLRKAGSTKVSTPAGDGPQFADAVFEIVTGLAPQLPGREVHHLRNGMGGDASVRSRED